MNKFFQNAKRGFTLVELLIVIIIIAVLAGIVLIALNPAQQRARATATALKTNTAAVCRAQAVCLVTSATGGDGCDTYLEIGMPDPYPGNAVPLPRIVITAGASPWTVTGTYTPDTATGVMSFTCQNIDSTQANFGRTSCATPGNAGATYSCAGFGL